MAGGIGARQHVLFSGLNSEMTVKHSTWQRAAAAAAVNEIDIIEADIKKQYSGN